jgi:hypothetical protein
LAISPLIFYSFKFVFIFETGPFHEGQAGLKLTIFLPQPPKGGLQSWPPHSAFPFILKVFKYIKDNSFLSMVHFAYFVILGSMLFAILLFL